jgi:hypothetical protein
MRLTTPSNINPLNGIQTLMPLRNHSAKMFFAFFAVKLWSHT